MILPFVVQGISGPMNPTTLFHQERIEAACNTIGTGFPG